MAMKAGKLAAGTEQAVEAVRGKKAAHVFLCSDASANTAKKVRDKCAFYGAPLSEIPLTMAELSGILGLKRLCAAAALTDAGFLNIINKANK